MPDVAKIDSEEDLFCPIWTVYSGRRKVSVHFQTDKDKLINVVYRNRNSFYHKDNEVGLNWTECQSLSAKRVYLFRYVNIFHKRCIVVDETTVHYCNRLHQKRMFFF